LKEADRLVPLLGALAIIAVSFLGLRDAARCGHAIESGAPLHKIESNYFSIKQVICSTLIEASILSFVILYR
jgi:hypothetical protein